MSLIQPVEGKIRDQSRRKLRNYIDLECEAQFRPPSQTRHAGWGYTDQSLKRSAKKRGKDYNVQTLSCLLSSFQLNKYLQYYIKKYHFQSFVLRKMEMRLQNSLLPILLPHHFTSPPRQPSNPLYSQFQKTQKSGSGP